MRSDGRVGSTLVSNSSKPEFEFTYQLTIFRLGPIFRKENQDKLKNLHNFPDVMLERTDFQGNN